MNIAIIGAGISGLTAAHFLNDTHQITVYEERDRIGGHTHTVEFPYRNRTLSVDTGFIVFNDKTYPNFKKLIHSLGVRYQDTSMSFSVKNEKSGLEYRGADLNGFFAQRSNLFRPVMYRILRDLIRFNRIAKSILQESGSDQLTVDEFFQSNRFSSDFVQNYFLPMGSAIWSCPHTTFGGFPMQFVMEFYSNHGLLSVADRPQWHVIRGGSSQYLKPLSRSFEKHIVLNAGVQNVDRIAGGKMAVQSRNGINIYDHVIFACHADQAMKLLGNDLLQKEKQVLSAFPYEKNEVILHSDITLLPENRRAWACWNYRVHASANHKATVTYNMNMLQGLKLDRTYCVSLNSRDLIDPNQIVRSFNYFHPIFTNRRKEMQSRHSELIGLEGASFCGAYWGNGFHEDGVVSAIRVVEKMKKASRIEPSPLEIASANG